MDKRSLIGALTSKGKTMGVSSTIINELFKKILDHPLGYIAVTIVGVFSFAFMLGIIVNPFVLAAEYTIDKKEYEARWSQHIQEATAQFKALNQGQCSLNTLVVRSNAENAIRAIEQEIYAIERAIQSGTATDRDHNRIIQLRVDRDRYTNVLNSLNNHPCQ